MEDFPSNSRKSKEEARAKPDVEKPSKVITGKVIRKKTLGSRTRDLFRGQGQSILDHIVEDIVIPEFKQLVWDVVLDAVERMLHGESDSSYRRSERIRRRGEPTRSHVSYNRAYGNSRYRDEPRERDRRPMFRSSYLVEDIVCDMHEDALTLRDHIERRIEDEGYATVSDVYQMAGMDSNSTDEEWGWVETSGITIRRAGRGYVLQLPRPEAMG